MRFIRPPIYRAGMQQRRTFLGLQRTPQPKPGMMAYLVVQGLAIVLLGDLAFATIMNDKTIVRSVAQAGGVWLDPPPFGEIHEKSGERVAEKE